MAGKVNQRQLILRVHRGKRRLCLGMRAINYNARDMLAADTCWLLTSLCALLHVVRAGQHLGTQRCSTSGGLAPCAMISEPVLQHPLVPMCRITKPTVHLRAQKAASFLGSAQSV